MKDNAPIVDPVVARPCYGSFATAPAPGRIWQWHSYGDPWMLLLGALGSVGQQVLALGLVAYQVLLKHKYLMVCNASKQGMLVAATCEYTKAHVRFFPLLALVVSLMVASRMLLHHRIYYETLRRGALIDFQNLNPWSDPLVYLMLWDLAHTIAHVALDLVIPGGRELSLMADWKTQAVQLFELKDFMLYYMSPTIVFLLFFYNAYDTEWALLPLNKYVEEDPETAAQMLMRTTFIREPIAAAVVLQEDFLDQKLEADATDGPSLLYAEFMERARSAQAHLQETENSASWAASGFGTAAPAEGHGLRTAWSSARPPQLSATLWPVRLLLHPLLNDPEGLAFKRVWYIFAGLCFSLMVGVGCLFCYYLGINLKEGLRGGYEDFATLPVAVGHATICGWLAYHLLVSFLA